MWVKPLKGLLFWIKWPVRIQTFVAGVRWGRMATPSWEGKESH